MSKTVRLRPSVRWFAEQMELQLRENDHKPGWKHASKAHLYGRLREETLETRAKGVRALSQGRRL